MRSLILALTLFTGIAPGPTSVSAAVHPVDGPDVDVRIQIQDRKVRFQIIMNLAYIDEIVDTPREDELSIQPAEHAAIRETLFGFYRESNTVKIDGVEVTPLDRGFEVEDGDLSMLPLFPRYMEKALVRVRLSLEYPSKGSAARVSFAWGKFPENPVLETPKGTPKIEINAHLIARGIDEIVPLTVDEPEYTWHDSGESLADRFLAVPKPPRVGSLRIPAVSAGLGLVILCGLLFVMGSVFTRNGRQRIGRRTLTTGMVALLLVPAGLLLRQTAVFELPNPFDGTPALPTTAQAETIFAPLHRNIYRAFDYVEESDIYDALARSVEGDLLDNLYNQVYRSLIMHEEGGAVSRVEAVRSVRTDVESIGLLPTRGERPGFQVLARWQVDGVVRHWNHAHYRTNEYEARYTVVQAEQGWRIADHQVLAQKRVDEGDAPPTGR